MEIDEYLGVLIGDIGKFITGTFHLIEFLLGISYFCGQTLAGWISVAGSFVLETFSQTSQFAILAGSELWDFGGSLVRGVLLIYYGIWMIFESFYVISMDLKSFTIHVFSSIGQICKDTQAATISHFSSAFSTVPNHILSSLMFIGEQTLSFFQLIIYVSIDFITQIFMAPVKALQVVGLLILKCGELAVEIYNHLPISAHVGLVVVILMCRLYWKLSVISALKRGFNLVKSLFKAIVQTLMLVKNSRRIFRQILKSSSAVEDESFTSSKNGTKALCVICQDETVSFISIPCKHVCLCYTCVKHLVDVDNRCPLCRGAVTKFERVYIPL